MWCIREGRGLCQRNICRREEGEELPVTVFAVYGSYFFRFLLCCFRWLIGLEKKTFSFSFLVQIRWPQLLYIGGMCIYSQVKIF